MAKYSMGYMGPFSGRLGTVVGYMWNGKCCLRAYQRQVHNPRTPAQVAHRDMFKQEVQLAANMRWAVRTSMTRAARSEGMTAYNLFVRGNQHAFGYADGMLRVDYASLRLSMGDVPPVVADGMELTDDNVLTVSFVRGSGKAYDQVYLYVYVPDLGNGFLSAPVYRRQKRISLALPDAYAGHELHAYLMVQSEDGRWSESTYVDQSAIAEQSLPENNTNILKIASIAEKEKHAVTDPIASDDIESPPPGK